jgi:hypothetical protein
MCSLTRYQRCKKSLQKYQRDHPEKIAEFNKFFYHNNSAYREKKKEKMREYSAIQRRLAGQTSTRGRPKKVPQAVLVFID